MDKKPRTLRLGMAQIDTTVGDFAGNLEKMVRILDEARHLKVDLVAFPELAICGYPPEDLLLKPQFIDKNLQYLENLVKASAGLSVVVGFVEQRGDLYNAAAVIHDGKHIGTYRKIYLPNYGVFDENRYFKAGSECPVYVIAGTGVGVNICEDIWYEAGPATAQAYAGAEVILNISASPYHYGKAGERTRILTARALDNMAIVAYTNLVGGQDELVFDGNSVVMNERGEVLARGKQFEEDFIVVDLDVEAVVRARLHDPRWRKHAVYDALPDWATQKIAVSEHVESTSKPPLPPREVKPTPLAEEIYNALLLGTRDYIVKNGFKKVVLGLSGGVDSALVATIATDALGNDNVIGVSMPSRYSSPGSITDAQKLAQNLGIQLLSLPIEKTFQVYLDSLADVFKNSKPDTTEENIQARIRGNFVMALSNKFDWLVLPTGNKSEMATGYATLYGDMAGGFAILKDVPKTLVYQLVAYRNQKAGFDLIPQAVIDKPPSAELRPDQRDSDSLPTYDILDQVLKAYVEEDKSVEQMLKMGLDEAAVRKAVKLVDGSEYKRRQAPPGIKITARAFGRDRRLPITNKFQGNG
ncbi:MAG: NAD+ synthase [Dehalococcoidia bacterium]|nr:MAG: NAD+ synthase [Dehalococcoidia bacterium]